MSERREEIRMREERRWRCVCMWRRGRGKKRERRGLAWWVGVAFALGGCSARD
jgi:hypothetical protein